MAEGNDLAMDEVVTLLEAETGSSAGVTVRPARVPLLEEQGSDIPALREQLEFLVSKSTAKEAIITKELSDMSGWLALRCGRLFALAKVALISTKHIDFPAASFEVAEQQRDADLMVLT